MSLLEFWQLDPVSEVTDGGDEELRDQLVPTRCVIELRKGKGCAQLVGLGLLISGNFDRPNERGFGCSMIGRRAPQQNLAADAMNLGLDHPLFCPVDLG